MKVYIAAPYPIRETAIVIMKRLEQLGYTVTSRWLKAELSPEESDHARDDLEDIDEADALLALNPESWSNTGTGGRHVEFGYAVAKGKKMFIIGRRSNCFHHLPNVRVIESMSDL
jgi:nucleoside 2-deoxyribosyltransferase